MKLKQGRPSGQTGQKRSPAAFDVKSRVIHLVAIFAVSVIFLGALEQKAKPGAFQGMYFQSWDSDFMFQTLPISQLKAHPFKALYYLHIQPPVLDLIRAALAGCFSNTDPRTLLRDVDGALYRLWIVAFAGMACVLFLWLRRLVPTGWAWFFTLAWIAHPAPICYATILEATFITSLGILWFFYGLWRMGRSGGSLVGFIAASLFLFFTKNLFQWYFFPLVAVSLALIKVSYRKIFVYLAVTLIMSCGYLVKQYCLFGAFTTCTSQGSYLCGMLWVTPVSGEWEQISSRLKFHYPPEASRYAEDALNNERTCRENLIYQEIFRKQWLSNPRECLKGLYKTWSQNETKYWAPSSRYYESGPHRIVDRLPWRKFYDAVFSAPLFIVLLAGSCLVWFFKQLCSGDAEALLRYRRAAALCLPLGYIYIFSHAGSIREWNEAERYKFYLEPIFYVFIAAQVSCLFAVLKTSLGRIGYSFETRD